jgi:hypothetical protein
LYREEIEVVAITPFMLEVSIPELADRLLELIKEEVEVCPLIMEVKVLIDEDKSF